MYPVSYTAEWDLLSEFKMFRRIILIAMSSSRGSCQIKHELKQNESIIHDTQEENGTSTTKRCILIQ